MLTHIATKTNATLKNHQIFAYLSLPFPTQFWIDENPVKITTKWWGARATHLQSRSPYGGDFHLENLISETLEIALELLEILGTYLIHFERADKKEEDPSDSACV
jgi:hypothetical protein